MNGRIHGDAIARCRYQRSRVAVIGFQSSIERFMGIVGPAFEWLAGEIVLHEFLRRMEVLVVRSTRRFVNESPENALLQEIVFDLNGAPSSSVKRET